MSAKSNHTEVIAEIGADMEQWAVQALNKAQLEALNYVRGDGLTTQMGAKVKTGPKGPYYWYSPSLPRRRAHPTLWADVTGTTANAYDYEEPKVEGEKIVGALFNTAPHAKHLEGKPRVRGALSVEKYWVLGGLVEGSEFKSDFKIGRVFEAEFNALVDNDS